MIISRDMSMLPDNKVFKKADYLLMFLLIQIGWISIFLNVARLELVIFIIVFYLSLRINKKMLFDKKILMIFIIYSSLSIVQGFIWGFSIVTLITSFSIVILLPYGCFLIYREHFLVILEKVIRFLTIISLIIWLAHQFIPGAKELIQIIIEVVNKNTDTSINRVRGMLFYTYWPQLDQSFGLSRNAGFASEPGQFDVFIILAIIINYSRNIQLFDKKNIFYFIALISSFSTAGYLALAALGLLLLKQRSSRIIGIILFPLFVFGAIFAYNNLNFMKSKINQQYESQTEASLDEPTNGRILGARKSLLVLLNHPLTGRGLQANTKPDTMSDPEYANYGWLSDMSRFGIIFGGLYLFFFFRGIYYFIRSGGNGIYEFIVCSLAIMINLSAQVYITSVFFIMFFFIGLYGYKKTSHKYLVQNVN